MMTVAELIEVLEECDPTTEVRVAFQPHWPLDYALIPEVVHCPAEDEDEGPGVVYLAEDRQVGYLPGKVAEELGWS